MKSRLDPLVWVVIASALATALYAAINTFGIFGLARWMMPSKPRPMPVPGRNRDDAPAMPLGGSMHVYHPPTHGGSPALVLATLEPWQRSIAADEIVKARTLHAAAVQRYSDMSPATKTATNNALSALPMTMQTVRWAQHPSDASGQDDGSMPPVEIIRGRDSDRIFAFVKTRQDLRPQVVAVLQRLFETDLQKAQIKALLTPAPNA